MAIIPLFLQKNKMSFCIRRAEPADNEIVFRFICDLAEYEKLSHEVAANPDILYESLFVKKSAEVIIAYESDEPVGFALYFFNFSTFKGKACLYLEDIYIMPSKRGKGYGKRLFERLASIALERECERFDWAVLNWNAPSIAFYEKLGAKPMNDWTVYRLDKKELKALSSKSN
jgi:GNAT superfamily N-acetyltransferase